MYTEARVSMSLLSWLQVHADYLKRRYVAAWCSLACLLNFLLVSGACILPLYISHASGNMWIKEAYHFEQPQVTYQNRLYVEISGLKGTALGYRQPFTAVWTTSAAANAMLGAMAARPMIIRSSTRDDNLDGTTDEVRISAALPLANDEVATSALVIAYHDVELQVSIAGTEPCFLMTLRVIAAATGHASCPLLTLSVLPRSAGCCSLSHGRALGCICKRRHSRQSHRYRWRRAPDPAVVAPGALDRHLRPIPHLQPAQPGQPRNAG